MGDGEVGSLDPDAGEEVVYGSEPFPLFFGTNGPGVQQLSFHQNLMIPQVKGIDFNLARVNRLSFGHFHFLFDRSSSVSALPWFSSSGRSSGRKYPRDFPPRAG
jgi:hypothetical protein